MNEWIGIIDSLWGYYFTVVLGIATIAGAALSSGYRPLIMSRLVLTAAVCIFAYANHDSLVGAYAAVANLTGQLRAVLATVDGHNPSVACLLEELRPKAKTLALYPAGVSLAVAAIWADLVGAGCAWLRRELFFIE